MLNADVEVDRRDFTVRAALSVAAGERVALFGPSGAGKTTVLETIAGLVLPRRGLVELRGRVLTSAGSAGGPVTVPPYQRRIGLLRQDPGLFPHLPVRANLLYARSSSGAEVEAIARELGIDGLLSAMPARLSGGQRHRVALGRLLLAHCDALLLDEPFASLDAALRRALTALVKDLSSERTVPSVLVTHQLQDAQAFADRLFVMDQGAVLQEGAPDEVVLRPASRRVAELVGYLGFVPVAPSGTDGTSGADPSADGSGDVAARGVVAGVHPDRVVPGADPSRGLVVTGTVEAARPSGAGWEADLRVGDAPFTCRLPSRLESAQVSVTVLDPPYFAPDGTRIADSRAPAEPRPLAVSSRVNIPRQDTPNGSPPDNSKKRLAEWSRCLFTRPTAPNLTKIQLALKIRPRIGAESSALTENRPQPPRSPLITARSGRPRPQHPGCMAHAVAYSRL